jgi:hypothetical protein
MFSSSALIEAPYFAVALAASAYAVARRHKEQYGEVVAAEPTALVAPIVEGPAW